MRIINLLYILLFPILVAAQAGKMGGKCTLGDCIEGRGRFVFSNGDVYDGEWHKGHKHGKGIYTSSSGHVYEGDYVNDYRHGWGVYTWKEGDKYEGEYVQNRREGMGIYFYADGSAQKGYFKNGKFQGPSAPDVPNSSIVVIDSFISQKPQSPLSWENGPYTQTVLTKSFTAKLKLSKNNKIKLLKIYLNGELNFRVPSFEFDKESKIITSTIELPKGTYNIAIMAECENGVSLITEAKTIIMK